ncbi:SusC/RagA family TonB-linked outer membrane protein [Dyadobacter fanqingshengii]|uniref:TonB-dependent receptor n=1 Tax=Dyadobacter fanqingshengii TaxID=2906443 RepID=A0A9X1PBE2_9BACT|nr:TonB-dependent receptor [Dyadobacter fanqingshengii]MCF0041470.1 TonB-dependent receptor [Dyadobacter fanqingshengii]USJ36811.1 TonB-dependent receptor [Dyadobacter fanqingshengii]
MKPKLLAKNGRRSLSTCLGFALGIFLASAVQASIPLPKASGSVKNAKGARHMAEQTITGTVSDENNVGIPGVNVLEKGTTNGVVSDENGKYSIQVKDANSVLVFSYIGYITKELKAGSQAVLDTKMEVSSQELNDVVVVGYGTQKRSELTNAVVQTTGAEIKKSSAASLSNSLAGRMAGVYVTQRSAAPGFDDAQILVRGASTYRNTSALIVIDGVANADPDGLNRLDPNDIESISVLKDASAAIYGAQSAGGVILVTTKRGVTGKPAFDFSTTQSWQSPTMKVKSADAFQYMQALNDRRALEGTPADFPDALVESFRNGTRRPEDWWKALIGPPVRQTRYSLTMRGGTDRVRYFVSLGTATQGGILRGDNKSKLRQYNVRSNVDVTVTKDLEVGLDLSIREKATQTPQGGPGGEVGSLASTSPLQEAYIGGDYRYPGEGWSHLNPAARLLSPGYRKYKADVASGTLRFKYNMPFVEGLGLDGYLSIVKTIGYDKQFNYVWPYFEKDPDGNIVEKVSRSVEDIGLREDFRQSLRTTGNVKLTYNRTFAQDHKLSAFVAYEQMTYDDNNFWAQRLGYDSPLIDQLFAGTTNRLNWNNSGSATESARQNFFGRLSYDFKQKYLFGFSARYDGSPIFPKDKRFGFFPQVSAGWVISNESFIPKNVISNLKLRASWGKLGNDRVSPFQYIAAYGYDAGWVVNGVDARGIAVKSTPNPNITWEVSEKTDIGLEAAFLNNRLSFELDLFQNKTSNILGRRQASIPSYTGLLLPDENIGKMNSQGIELQAGYRHNFSDLTVRVNGNFSYNKNKIIYFDETPQAEEYQKLEGQPFGSRLVYKSIGIYRTQQDLDNGVNYPGASLGGLIFADLNGDKIIDSNDQYMFNTTNNTATDPVTGLEVTTIFPSTQYGLSIGMNYKNFDLAMLLQGQSGAKFRLSNGFNSGAGGNGLEYVALNSYTLGNVNSELPMISPTGFANSDSDFYYRTATWMRMKNVQLGYTLPKSLLSKAKIAAFRVYVSGDNIFMIFNSLKKFGNGDPEFLSGNGGAYPNMKTMSFGVNLTF